MAQPDELLGRVTEGNESTLRYSRQRFLGTWLALAGLALLASLALWLGIDASHQAEQLADQADVKASDAQQSTDDVVKFLRGEQGIPGVPGADGEDGTPGQPGSAGSGAAGPSGQQGDRGPQGPPGPVGQAGVGATGTTGLPGEQGGTGAQGPAGAKGDTGPAGPRGETGARGQAGQNGQDGTNGADGAVGPQGPVGPPRQFSVVTATSESSPFEPKTVQVSCATGQVVGGGYTTAPQTALRLVASWPQGPVTWTIIVENAEFPPDVAWSVTAWAVCAT